MVKVYLALLAQVYWLSLEFHWLDAGRALEIDINSIKCEFRILSKSKILWGKERTPLSRMGALNATRLTIIDPCAKNEAV